MDPSWTTTVLQRYIRKIGLTFFGAISRAFDTLSLDMGNIQALLESQNDGTKLIVEGIADRKTKKRFTSAEDKAKQTSQLALV